MPSIDLSCSIAMTCMTENFPVLSKFHHTCRLIVEYLSFHTGYEIFARRAPFYYTYHSYSVFVARKSEKTRGAIVSCFCIQLVNKLLDTTSPWAVPLVRRS